MINFHSISTQIDRFPFDIPGVRVITQPIMSVVYLIFHQLYVEHQDKQKIIEENSEIERKEKIKENLFNTIHERIRLFEIKQSNREKNWDKEDREKGFIGIDEFIKQRRRERFLKREFTKEEWEIMFPKPSYIHYKINHEYQKEFKKAFLKAHPELIERGLYEEPEKKDSYRSLRIAFKVSCIFFCMYMAYPMI